MKAGVEETIRGEVAQSPSPTASAQMTPPMSPKSSLSGEIKDGELTSTLQSAKSGGEGFFEGGGSQSRSNAVCIPQFYFPEGSPAVKELRAVKSERIRELFRPYHPIGMQQKEFVKVVQEVCDFARNVGVSPFPMADGGLLITQEAFESWWESE